MAGLEFNLFTFKIKTIGISMNRYLGLFRGRKYDIS